MSEPSNSSPDYAEALFNLALLERGSYLSSGRKERILRSKPMLKEALITARNQLQGDDRNAYNHFMVAMLTLSLAGTDEELAFRWGHAGDLDEGGVASLRQKIEAAYLDSERHFRATIALNPSLTEAYLWLADAIERQGVERRAEALQVLEDGQVRDPFNLQYNGRIAKRWAGRGRYRQAIELLERFKSLPQIPPMAWWWQLEIMELQNYWDDKCETLIAMLQSDPGAFADWNNRWQVWWYVSTLAELGLYEEARAWKESIENLPMKDWMYQSGLNNYRVAMEQREKTTAREDEQELIEQDELERAVEALETDRFERAMWHERAPRDDLELAALYQLLGRHDDVATLLDAIVTQLETEFAGGVRHWETLYHLSEAYARQGRDEEALEMLRKSYDYHNLIPCDYWEEEAVASPWPRFRNDGRYVSLCERIDDDRQQQAKRIRTMLAQYDIDELLAPLMVLAEAAQNK